MKRKFPIAIILLCLVVLAGCLKETPIEPPKPVAYLSVLNMTFNAPAVEMFFGDEKVTAPISPGISFSRYSALDAGALNVSFKKVSSDSIVASLPAGQLYDSSSFYTIMLHDDQNGGSRATRIRDVFPPIDNTKCFVRFFHLSEDLPEVDIDFENTRVFSSRSLADNALSPGYNQFEPYTPGIYSIKAKIAGTDSVVASTSYSDLMTGGIYTIYLKGDTAGIGPRALGIEVLRAAN